MNGKLFVERIDDSLKRINKKRQALAEYCGVTVQSISDWARRGNLPQADTTKRIADFLGVSIELLVDDDYQTQWNEVVDADTKQAIVSPCEICYRIDSLIKEKSTVSVQDSDDIFYAEIFDILQDNAVYIPVCGSNTLCVTSQDLTGVTFNTRSAIPTQSISRTA